jgi:hypothetical protein
VHVNRGWISRALHQQHQQVQQQTPQSKGPSAASPLWRRPEGRVSVEAVVGEGEKVTNIYVCKLLRPLVMPGLAISHNTNTNCRLVQICDDYSCLLCRNSRREGSLPTRIPAPTRCCGWIRKPCCSVRALRDHLMVRVVAVALEAI